MEFLKEILGDELFGQVSDRVNAYNENEENKDKQLKLANLGTGDYVGKGKFDGLQEQLSGKDTELESANKLIAELKKSTKGNEELQSKIATYETENAELQKELQQTKLKAAVKIALLSENAAEVEFLTFKLNEKLAEKGKSLEIDENDNIKDWEEMIGGLKVQYPQMFVSHEVGTGEKVIDPNKLKKGEHTDTVTKEQFQGMTYEQRVELKQNNEKLYEQLAKG